jgi:hypothetical protein
MPHAQRRGVQALIADQLGAGLGERLVDAGLRAMGDHEPRAIPEQQRLDDRER